MEFEKNTMLFGADPTPRIVAIELGETGTVKVYRREKDGPIVTLSILASKPRNLRAISNTGGASRLIAGRN